MCSTTVAASEMPSFCYSHPPPFWRCVFHNCYSVWNAFFLAFQIDTPGRWVAQKIREVFTHRSTQQPLCIQILQTHTHTCTPRLRKALLHAHLVHNAETCLAAPRQCNLALPVEGPLEGFLLSMLIAITSFPWTNKHAPARHEWTLIMSCCQMGSSVPHMQSQMKATQFLSLCCKTNTESWGHIWRHARDHVRTVGRLLLAKCQWASFPCTCFVVQILTKIGTLVLENGPLRPMRIPSLLPFHLSIWYELQSISQPYMSQVLKRESQQFQSHSNRCDLKSRDSNRCLGFSNRLRESAA